MILCEDTRVTRKLLDRYGVEKPLLSYHRHSRLRRLEEIVALLQEGKTLALVSDAGTPGINDPGNELIEYLLRTFRDRKTRGVISDEKNFAVAAIPGPNAAIAALSVSGFPSDRFLFLGYPPPKRKRRKFFAEIAAREDTVVLYESPHRILRTLEELGAAIGERPVAVARELTKKFETIYRGTAREVLGRVKTEGAARGEFVVVAGAPVLP